MADCTHGMPTPAACVDCMDEGNLPAPRREKATIEYTFTARFAGHCGACNLPVSAGQKAARLSTGALVHGWCTP